MVERWGRAGCLRICGEGELGGGQLWGRELAWRQRCLSPVFPAGLLLAHDNGNRE